MTSDIVGGIPTCLRFGGTRNRLQWPVVSQTARLCIGTSAFSAAGWERTFYPEGMKPAQYFSHYAQHFETVEVDSTFYRTPAASTVNGWHVKTPPFFIFALKVTSENGL
jgi:hypothetical protein